MPGNFIAPQTSVDYKTPLYPQTTCLNFPLWPVNPVKISYLSGTKVIPNRLFLDTQYGPRPKL